jgi:hypothetical protein
LHWGNERERERKRQIADAAAHVITPSSIIRLGLSGGKVAGDGTWNAESGSPLSIAGPASPPD